jgi:hypothetical protein
VFASFFYTDRDLLPFSHPFSSLGLTACSPETIYDDTGENKNRKEVNPMLFMTVYTYEPGNRQAVIRKRAEQGQLLPPGAKTLGEWSAVGGGPVFRLVEVDSVQTLLAAANPWADLGKIESYAVMPVDDVIKLLAGKK